eukprot:764215-Hanusia_phi.AAC.3
MRTWGGRVLAGEEERKERKKAAGGVGARPGSDLQRCPSPPQRSSASASNSRALCRRVRRKHGNQGEGGEKEVTDLDEGRQLVTDPAGAFQLPPNTRTSSARRTLSLLLSFSTLK